MILTRGLWCIDEVMWPPADRPVPQFKINCLFPGDNQAFNDCIASNYLNNDGLLCPRLHAGCLRNHLHITQYKAGSPKRNQRPGRSSEAQDRDRQQGTKARLWTGTGNMFYSTINSAWHSASVIWEQLFGAINTLISISYTYRYQLLRAWSSKSKFG